MDEPTNLHPNPGALRAIVCSNGLLCKKVTWTNNPTVGGFDADLSRKKLDETNPECGPHRIVLYHAVGMMMASGRYVEGNSMDEPIYIVQYRKAEFQSSEKTMVSVAVEAKDALLAIERANERLNQLPREEKWLVHAVGPGNQPGGQTAFL